MALINCPECGKEVSDKASTCPTCGCPIDEKIHIKRHDDESFFSTGYTGRKGLECPNPKCRGKNIEVLNDIPTWKKAAEIASFGTVTEITKKEYRQGMAYRCRDCGMIWDESGILDELPEEKTVTKNKKIIPVSTCIISAIFFGVSLYAIMSGAGIMENILQFLYSAFGLSGAFFNAVSLKNKKSSRIAVALYFLSAIMSILMVLRLDVSAILVMIPLVFLALSEIYYDKE